MDILSTRLFIFAISGFVLLLAIGGAIGFALYRRKRWLGSSAEVAAALGLEKRVQLKQMWWYEGKWKDGRSFGFSPIGMRRRNYSFLHERTVTRYDPAVRIIIELLVAEPLGVELVRHIKWETKRPLDNFEAAFNAENGDKLMPNVKVALLDFVRQQPCTLWLADRATISDRVITSSEIMQGTTAVLLFEYETANPETEEVCQHVASLVTLANILESPVASA